MNSIEFKRLLFNPKVDKPNLLSQIKKETSFPNFAKLIEASLSHPASKNLLLANPLPKNYKDIRQGRLIPYSGNLIGELAWNLSAVKRFSKEINLFLNLKDEYEKAFLLGDYNQCSRVLGEIELKVCKSLWSLENRFLLCEFQEGVESNWTMLSSIVKEMDDPLLLFFSENLSKRAESKITYFRFRNLFANQIADIDGPDEFKEYLCYRLNYPAYVGFESYPFMLAMESISSVVDRYLLLRDVLVQIAGSNEHQKMQAATTILLELRKDVVDPVLIQLSNFLESTPTVALPESKNILRIVDLYTRGEYQHCIASIPTILANCPYTIEMFEIYVKSFIELRLPFRSPLVSALIDEILANLYSIFSRDHNAEEATEKLLKTVLSFISTNWARQLFSLIIQQGNINRENRIYHLLFVIYSASNNPRILNYIDPNSTVFKNQLTFFEQNYSNNTAVLVNYGLSEGNLERIANNLEISKKRKELYIGRILIKQRNYSAAVNHYLNLLKDVNLSMTAYEEIIENLYIAYLSLNHLKDATLLYVSNYLANPHLVTKFKRELLLSLLEKKIDAEVKGLIDLPIYFKIVTSDPYKQYVAYDTFLNEHNIERPSHLLNLKANFNTDKLIYFFKEVCTSEILQHSYVFDGSDDMENERLTILRELLVLDKENESQYIKEIAEVTQNSIIRKAIREINKGRITVNVQQLKNIETANIKEGFNRYRELSNYGKNKDLVAVDTSSKLINEYLNSLSEDRVKNKIVFTNDPAYITFKVMFIELRDQFILSKEYGLDGYLSTRIRHGTLLNHIRSVFESLNLVSQKGSDGNYRDSVFWQGKIPFNLSDRKNDIQKSIRKFSMRIDEYTEYIIKELIQIKTEKYQKKPYALFDYGINQVELANIFALVRDKVKDYEGFLNITFEYLEAKSEILLKEIRNKFNHDIKNEYNLIISDFQLDIKGILGDSIFVDLTSSIAKCSTYIQNELRNISEWFYLSNPSTDLTLDLKTIIQSSLEITNSIYPNNKITPRSIDVDFDYPIVGSLHLIYIVKILLDNIIVHSGLYGDDKMVEISATSNDKTLSLIFKNNVSGTINTDELRRKLNIVKQEWINKNDGFDNLNTEGGSGFGKIRKIIALDMSRRSYDFDYSLIDSELSIIITFNFELKDDVA